MVSASTIILEYVCPSLGVIICQFMFSAPYRDLKAAIERGNLGDLNPTPWAFMLGNCLGWVTYSILLQNQFIFWANAPGFLLSIYLNLGAVKLLYQGHHSRELRKSLVVFLEGQSQQDYMESQALTKESTTSATRRIKVDALATREGEEAAEENDQLSSSQTTSNNDTKDWATIIWNVTSQTTPAPAPHETLVMVVVTIWLACLCLISFGQSSIDQEMREVIVGSVVNLNLVFFYGAPLSSIYKVLRTKDSSSIHFRTMITNTLNSSFWTAYGFAVQDFFIYVPNGLGSILGAIQLVLLLLYPRKASTVVPASPAALDDITPGHSTKTVQTEPSHPMEASMKPLELSSQPETQDLEEPDEEGEFR